MKSSKLTRKTSCKDTKEEVILHKKAIDQELKIKLGSLLTEPARSGKVSVNILRPNPP